MKFPTLLTSLIALIVLVGIIPADNSHAGSKKTSCPAFTSSMVDAAAMAFGLFPGGYTSVTAEDDPTIPMIYCNIVGSPTVFTFSAEVNYSDPNFAIAFGKGAQEDTPSYDARLYSGAEDLSIAEMRACRVEILKSFVWKNHCAPFLQ